VTTNILDQQAEDSRMNRPIAVILAAGKGTRMKSDLPKVLVPVNGRPLVDYVLDALDAADIDQSIVVVGYRGDDVRRALANRPGVQFVEQREQLGTGHAVRMAAPLLADHVGPVLVLTGDSPLTQPDSLRALLALFERDRPACVLGTLIKDDPSGLGRIVRDKAGVFRAVVEEKDATPEQRAIKEVNMSTYVFDSSALLRSLAELTNDNRQGEYYITDCPGILRAAGEDVRALPVLKPCEALSVNTVEDLQTVEQYLAEHP
jgi:bifunctional UDP-N-acetylglucosamine pyrophosphorylase/glucosamine-1-phosphate N-acetyltransferase/UDP-N-acetylglucosamine pyrophosphorylase